MLCGSTLADEDCVDGVDDDDYDDDYDDDNDENLRWQNWWRQWLWLLVGGCRFPQELSVMKNTGIIISYIYDDNSDTDDYLSTDLHLTNLLSSSVSFQCQGWAST